jgi:hypothetical protein
LQDLIAKREKLLVEATDCDLIANLATDTKKRELFSRLSKHITQLADDIAREIAEARGAGSP